jgi:hypothetical protein
MRLPDFVINRLRDFISDISWIDRQPDYVINSPIDGTRYLDRWYVIPRNPVANAYAHCFWRSDYGRDRHDHPWLFNVSIVLEGAYIEELIGKSGEVEYVMRRKGDVIFRVGGTFQHRIQLVGAKPFTLFLTGPRYRKWGFYTQDGWVYYKDYLKKLWSKKSEEEN